MLRNLVTIGVSAAVLFAVSSASAQPAGAAFGDEHQAILSVDRLMPIFQYENDKASPNGGSGGYTVSYFGLVTHGTQATFYNIPRFAFDYTVWKHLTVGGSAYIWVQTGSNYYICANGGPCVDQPSPAKTTFFGIAPRVGWILQFSDIFSFWPRGGISFNDATHSSYVTTVGAFGGGTTTQFALDLEPMFAFTPVPHAGITFGGNIDIPITGSVDNNNGTSTDTAQFAFGLNAGLLIWF